MAKTNLQRKQSYYNRIIKEGKKSRHSVKYQRICTALDALVGTADILREHPKGSIEPIPEELTDQLRDAYIDLAENTYRYIELKKLVPFQTRGQKRLEVARGLMSFANETLDKLGAEIDIEERIQKADEAQQTEMDEAMIG